ncbi:MAG: hypothetical protein QS98_C0012G0024 [archaeon GW2011_AR3]|nr:MAG: hypothetical protein QS98_C0012G0024 [archaeon GW2011_AR3]MBS3109008.1 hypothetical protein [Candidatus Woesearchaeota archaeon]
MRWFFGSVAGGVATLMMTLLASVMLIFLGLIYFFITLWIIKVSSGWLGYSLDGNWAVLSASLISSGTMIGSSLKK